jgi:dihydrofolate reductase
MRRVVTAVAVSLDGYLATESGELDWIFPNVDQELDRWILDSMRRTDTQLLGRVNFEEQAAFWPTADGDLAEHINEVEKVVFSATLTETTWNNSRIARGSVHDELAELRARDGREILVPGGARFLQYMSAQGLIDEYRLMVHPVVLGRGLPLFADPVSLALAGSRAFGTGVLALTYRRC